MVDRLIEEVLFKIEEASDCYHRLVLVVGPIGSGKTKVMQGVAEELSRPLINVNLELSRRLLELSERERVMQAQDRLEQILEEMDKIHKLNFESIDSSFYMKFIKYHQDKGYSNGFTFLSKSASTRT